MHVVPFLTVAVALFGTAIGTSPLVPVRGRVHLVSSLPSSSAQLAPINAALSSAADVSRSFISRGQSGLCGAANSLAASSNDLVVLVGDQNDGACDVAGVSLVHVQFSAPDFVSVSYKSLASGYLKSTARVRSDASGINTVLKNAFHDILLDDFLNGGDVYADSITGTSRGFFSAILPFSFSTLFNILLGGAIAYLIQTYVLVQQLPGGAVPVSASDAAVIQELESFKPAELRAKKKKTPTGAKNVPHSADQFRHWMKLVTEFCIDYMNHPEVYDVVTGFKPGFLYKSFPKEAPQKAEPFENIMRDLYTKIMPGMTHWQHPRFHSYFVTGCCYPDIMADAIISSFGILYFNWDSSPAMTELEVGVINWLGRLYNLPEAFLFQGNVDQSPGGGSFQESASDAIFICLLAARNKKIKEITGKSVALANRDSEHQAITKLVAYANREAHSCIEKAALLALVHMRSIPGDHNLELTGENLEKAIKIDLDKGLTPFFVHVTCGTTATGAFDRLAECVAVAKKYNMWVHVDGAYGGNSWALPEMRATQKGIEDVDSVNINMQKVFLHSTSASGMWTRNQRAVKEALSVDPAYLKPRFEGTNDFRHWGTALSRRARCMKSWFICRLYGADGMREYVRRMHRISKHMHSLLEKDPRIEIIGNHTFTVSAFRLKMENEKEADELTSQLSEYINHSRKLAVTYARPANKSVIRISINHPQSLEQEMNDSYNVLSELIDEFTLLSQKGGIVTNPMFRNDKGVIGSPAPLSSASSSMNLATGRALTPAVPEAVPPGC
uniref:ANK_REP_REGION domain-containing protein n=1 Tax=Panagrellus redivivus TaxID=6233 RepID=A0A7E4ZZ90_PANRE